MDHTRTGSLGVPDMLGLWEKKGRVCGEGYGRDRRSRGLWDPRRD